MSEPREVIKPMKIQRDIRKDALAAGKTSTAKKSVASSFRPANLREHFVYSRAMEAVLWGVPVVNFDRMHQALVRDANGAMNEILYWSGPADWKIQMLTPNPDVIYTIPFFDLKEAGPMVLKIPPAGYGMIVGSINDCWQDPLQGVASTGVDKGDGGDYLILPPGFNGNIPKGYIPLRSNYYRGYARLSSVLKSSSRADIENAEAFAKQVQLYPLSAANNSEPSIFTDATDLVYDSTIPFDLEFFQSLSRMIQYEPWLSRDKVMIDLLKTIGIEKDKPFKPDLRTEEILDNAANDARQWLDSNFETSFPRFYRDRQWTIPVPPDIETTITPFESADDYAVGQRGLNYYYALSAAKPIGPDLFCLFTLRDKNGEFLDGGLNYCLTIPPNVPVNQYWSMVVYDRRTHTFIRNVPHPGRSSREAGLQKNADGSTDIYFGPKPPPRKESNWIPTLRNGSFEVFARFYGAQKALFERMWSLKDIEQMRP